MEKPDILGTMEDIRSLLLGKFREFPDAGYYIIDHEGNITTHDSVSCRDDHLVDMCEDILRNSKDEKDAIDKISKVRVLKRDIIPEYIPLDNRKDMMQRCKYTYPNLK